MFFIVLCCFIHQKLTLTGKQKLSRKCPNTLNALLIKLSKISIHKSFSILAV